ncbi:precorrin-6y C5,15-methyltransferase (decarboxylating) subunit CbiE (plasmid) [Pseudorhodobacter turbinis]|uniref:Precorrin-6y C5,15-methyltransferase (Decarboxylating) subunit CbiE n=1 Tax=Pseudorhodobacter turbinis TaxID=2500533 RepID=A0A4P8ELD4_9RHOB|nr:precorrin-6y C5,15-methyltransferase (decarboxylating) subunit CbiE [Pseudorhodobacter turbinis]QCO57868.1 precorrin-6y C5,15-methyltransferase (decarboxylating) subunit CbiE [Pseudorhodobacter turbinis]
MVETPWLTIIGLGEDGPEGLSPASRDALTQAKVVMGPPRHLALLGETLAKQVEWPVPFADGLPLLLALRGQRVVVLASGDPFCFGAGSVIAAHLDRREWRAFPTPSTFSLAAAQLGWRLEETLCLGLHAAPLARLRPHLASGARAIVLLRDGHAPHALAAWLCAQGFGETRMTVMESLGGPRQRITNAPAQALPNRDFAHPLCVALEVAGNGPALPRSSGIDDSFFETDGQITKRPIRALTLSVLEPRAGLRLWDIGGGSGSIAVEWLLTHPTTQAVAIEPRADRAATIRRNADRLGVDRLQIVEGHAPKALADLPRPDAVFIGGGLSDGMLDHLTTTLPQGTRLVANAVTLESEALLASAQARLGGTLLRIELARAAPLGSKRGWKASYPVVQWAVVL